MKRFSKKISMLLSMVLVLGACGCGGNNDDKIKKDPNALRILVWEGGYGSEWLDNLAEKYEELNENITVKVDKTPLRDKVTLHWQASRADNKYDLLFSDGEIANVAYTDYKIPGEKHAFAELSDVLDSYAYGETTTKIKDKMIDGAADYFLAHEENNNSVYCLPAMSTASGWIYNEAVFSDCGVEIPRTTDEFYEVCKVLKEHGYTPFIFSGTTDYYTPRVYDWWIQYNGFDDFRNYFSGKAYDEMEDKYKYSQDIFQQKGLKYALEAFEDLFSYKNGASDPECFIDTNGTGYLFMQAQGLFIDKSNKKTNTGYTYAMMSNGGWFENEMKEFATPGSNPLRLMKTPLLSDIVYMDKDAEKEAQTPVMTEEKLRECVDYLNNKTSKPEGVSDEILEKLDDAYNRVNLGGFGFTMYAPSTSEKNDLAKDFMRFYYSDIATEIIMKSACGGLSPVNYDYSSVEGFDSLTPLQKDVYRSFSSDYSKSHTFRDHPLVYKGGLQAIPMNLYTSFCSVNPADRRTAQQVYDYNINYFASGTSWQDLLMMSGIAL